MDTPATPAQDRLDALIHEAAHLAVWLAGHVRDFLAPQAGKLLEPRFLRHVLRHYLIPAEAALRRALHLMTTDMPALPVRARRIKPPPRAIPPRHPAKPKTVRPPTFRLTEPQPRETSDDIAESRRPRIRVLTPGLPSALPKPSRRQPASLESRLRRRVAALEAAIANPVREARRLQRLQARLKARRPLLSFTKIPGYRAKPLNDIARTALDEANAALLDHHLRGPDTS